MLSERSRSKPGNSCQAIRSRSLGAIIAQKRAQHAQEKNDLTAVVYCRQNPAGNWTFPNKAPMPTSSVRTEFLVRLLSADDWSQAKISLGHVVGDTDCLSRDGQRRIHGRG